MLDKRWYSSYDRLRQTPLEKHKALRGKLGLQLKDGLDTKEQLSTYYTPGVGAVSPCWRSGQS